jgi:hypothetical protein
MYWWFTVFKSYSPGLISVITFSSRSWRTLRSEISNQAATAFEVYAFKNRTPFLLCPNWSLFFFFSPYPFIFLPGRKRKWNFQNYIWAGFGRRRTRSASRPSEEPIKRRPQRL